MIRIKIAGDERQFNLNSIDEQWIAQQINNRQRAGQLICVTISLDEGSCRMLLKTGACAASAGGTRRPTRQEAAIFEAWDKFGLGDKEVNSGKLIAFLKQLRGLC